MLRHYLSTALRHFRRHKLTTGINVVCLTTGLVCFLAIYAALVFIEAGDRHYANADRIYMLRQSIDGSPPIPAASWPVRDYLKANFPQIEAVARTTFDSGFGSEVPIAASADKKTFVHVAYADPEFLEVFALPFLAGDSKRALRTPRSAVISSDLAMRLFGGVPQASGRNLQLQDGRQVTVRGVVSQPRQPSHIATGSDNALAVVRFDVMISMDVYEEEVARDDSRRSMTTSWDTPFFITYVVLPRVGSFNVASLNAALHGINEQHAKPNGTSSQFSATPLTAYWLRNFDALMGSSRTGISAALTFYFLGAIVLLISCVNYANLAAAQAKSHAREIGIRRVVGAHGGQIVVQLLFEAALLSATALLLAVMLITSAILSMQSPMVADVVAAAVATPKFWLMLLALLGAVTVAAGIYPSSVSSRVRPLEVLRAGTVRSGGKLASRLLVGLQFAGASFLLISMLVMNEQNMVFERSALRGSADTLVTIANNVRATGIDFDALRTELLQQPHIKSVTGSGFSPWQLIVPTGKVASSSDKSARKLQPTISGVNYDFFSTLGIRLLAGRVLDRQHADDDVERAAGQQAGNPPNVVIDQALVEQSGWLRPADALGKTLYLFDDSDPSKPPAARIVVGVVENRPMSIMNPMNASSNLYQLAPTLAAAPIIRIATSDSAVALKEIESVWEKLAPAVALKTKFADEVLEHSYMAFRLISTIFGGIAALALTISILGLIGMSMHIIRRRLHEIGVRKTLGSSTRGIVGLLLVDFSKPVIVANVIAWPLAFMAMSLYVSLFTQRAGLTAGPFLASLMITVAVAWIAVAAQAMRAARLSPVTVLRYE